MSNQELQTIDAAALAQVSGGTTISTTATTGDPVMTALTGILSSIQSMTQQQQQPGGFNTQEMMMLFMMMQQRNQPYVAAAPIAAPGPWGAPPGYYY